jgi:surfeit locus 1 family protein
MSKALLTPRWIITTLLVIVAVGFMARLGFWQLDRLEQRRAANAQVAAQRSAPPLDLNTPFSIDSLTAMEYRSVIVRGVYDPQNEMILRNQVNESLPGYHILTPLKIDGSSLAIIVDRGFIPMEQGAPADRARYGQSGMVAVQGILRLPHIPRYFGVPDPTLVPGQSRLDAWNAVNLPRMQQQVSYPLLPVYIEAVPVQAAALDAGYPVAAASLPDVSEGPHLGYAIQWFSFAGVLALGYPFFVKKQLTRSGAARHKQKTVQLAERQV